MFKTNRSVVFVLLLLSGMAQAFTYQGELSQAGGLYDGVADLQFRLFNAETGGAQVGLFEARNGVDVVDGRFVVNLDDWAVLLDGTPYWLQIQVAIPTGGSFVVLDPRQKLGPAPYAEHAYDVDGSLWVKKAGDTMSGDLVVNGFVDIHLDQSLKIGGVPFLKTDFNNTFVGTDIGESNSGVDNTFVGFRAGEFNITGSDNSFLGYHAGQDNTDGDHNAFFGSFAGSSNTIGLRNTFIGARAGIKNTEGRRNTFIGFDSGYENTIGNYNTFTGYYAGRANIDGEYNTFTGYYAGHANTNGNNNTFNGREAGVSNLSGSNNTFIGFFAGQSNTDAANNTFVGFEAGKLNTTGASNTYIGNRAGLNNVTGNSNVFIGRQAGGQSSGSELLFIDNTDTASPLIWGDFASNFMDVNGRLHVKRGVAGVGVTTDSSLHVAVIENTSALTPVNVLALKVGNASNPGSNANFITFKDGADTNLGGIEGNGSGGVTLLSGAADYAEYLLKVNSDEQLAPADIVGVFNGNISKNTTSAQRAMVVSSNAIVSGNDPGEGRYDHYGLIAFMGQADVKVRGAVRAGDYIIPDGNQQGVGIAVHPELITLQQFPLVVGQAWQASEDDGVKRILTMVGLQHNNPIVAQLQAQNRRQSSEIAELKSQLLGVVQQVADMQKTYQHMQQYAVK